MSEVQQVGVAILGVSGVILLIVWVMTLFALVDLVARGKIPWGYIVLWFCILPLLGLLLVIFG